MRNKAAVIVIAALLLSLLCAGAPAEAFSLRGGITWGMQEEEIAGIMMAEPEADRYKALSIPWNDYELMPLEEQYHQLYSYYVIGVDPNDAYDVTMVFVCTKRDGLYEVLYLIMPKAGGDETLYAEALRQVLLLEAEYGPLTGHVWDRDDWENKEIVRVGDYVYLKGTVLPDGTEIQVMMDKVDRGNYELWVEYRSGDCLRIEAALRDGSYYAGLEPGE